ncbi:MAG: DUF7326 family protein [Holophagaceae bacterium]
MTKNFTNSQLAYIAKRHVSEQIDKMSLEDLRTYAYYSMLEDFQVLPGSGDYEEDTLINDMLEGYDEDGVIKRLRSWGFNDFEIEDALDVDLTTETLV